jgi:hypothetical protein
MAFETLIILNNDLSLVGEHMKHIRAGERRKGSEKRKIWNHESSHTIREKLFVIIFLKPTVSSRFFVSLLSCRVMSRRRQGLRLRYAFTVVS